VRDRPSCFCTWQFSGVEGVALLSFGLWQELGGNPAVIGTSVTLDGRPRTVIGVMPRGFWFPDPSVRIWSR
jgi:putative ABC transport system permease protein